MGISKIKPEGTYESFYSKESIAVISKRLGVSGATLSHWWQQRFGMEAYMARVKKRPKVNPEDTYPFFYSKEGTRVISKRFGIARHTLVCWWKKHFGEDAYIARIAKKVKPEDIYPFFHSKEGTRAVAKRFGITRETVKNWWKQHFGEIAYAARIAKEGITKEERKRRKKVKRAEYVRNNQEKVKALRKVAASKYYRKHKKEIAQRQRSYYLQHPDKQIAYNKAYYETNTEQLRKYAIQYRVKNKAIIKSKAKARLVENPAKLLLSNAKARAKKFGVPFNLTLEDIQVCIPLDGLCPITKEPFERGEGKVGPRSMTLDRVIPNLGYVRGNIAVISHKANVIKQNCTNPEIFRKLAQYLKQKRINA